MIEKPRNKKNELPPIAATDVAVHDVASSPLLATGVIEVSKFEPDVAMPDADKPWFLYLIECKGGSYYAGITTDVAKRFQTHLNGKGAKYTRSRKPMRLLGARVYANHSLAAKAEWAIKQLKKPEKLVFLHAVVVDDATDCDIDTISAGRPVAVWR